MEAKIESRVYRVEAFIIPKVNCAKSSDADINKRGDVKFLNKLKFRITKTIEQAEEEDQDLLNKSNNAENLPLNQVDTETLESAETLNNSDSSNSSKKESINSFNEYQEEPDFETLIKSPELLESYSNQLETENTSSERKESFPGLKKCLVDFMEEEKEKIKKEFIIGPKEEESNLEFNESFKQLSVKEIESISIINEIEGKQITIESEKNKTQTKEIEEKEEQEKEIGKEIHGNDLKEEIQVKKFKEPKVTKFIDFHNPLPKLEEQIYDEPFVGNLCRNPKNSRHTLDLAYVQAALLNVKAQGSKRVVPKPPNRCSSLKSIDEGVEIVDTNFEDICYHGHKNGCTVTVQKPEDVSQDIFKDNWMQRLETLRQREALLRDKEIALQSRERLLFKKEKELRILERMVKDKMKQAELYLKRCKNSQSLENVFDEKNIESRSSDGSGGSKVGFVLNVANTDKRVPFVGEGLWLKAPELKYELTNENLRNLPPSRNSLGTIPSDVKYGSKFSAYSNFRCKPKPKISYDDMDSTLSADVGDASFVITSRKFDPVVFKKPAAFSRSASERRPKMNYKKEEYPEFEENKILRKVSENIFVSQNKDTKYQHYGIIDKNVKSLDLRLVRSDEEEKKYGYLNLEVDGKTKRKSSKGLKTRPISWSAETDDWLQKKRKAFNSANQKCVNSCDKENLELNSKTVEYSTIKKKSGKGKKFSIFR